MLAALAVISTALPTIFGTKADETEPELSSRCETVMEETGKSTTFGTAGTDLRINSRIKYDEAKDLSEVDIIECNVFVENAAALKNFVSDTQKFCLYFSSNNSRETRNRSYADLSAQIKENGWNTVRVYRSDFTDGVNWSSVRYLYLGFTEETDVTLPEALAEKQVKFKNVCDILALPAITDEAEKPDLPEYDLVISEEGIPTKTWGAKYGFTADQLYNTDPFEPALDISGMDRIEFDIYIRDSVSFRNAVEGKALRFTVASGSTRYKKRSAYDFADQITEDGWNHIVIEKSVCAVSNLEGTTDFASICWLGFAFWNSADKENPIGDTAVRIVNIGATIAEYSKLPDAPDYSLMISREGVGPKTWGSKYDYTRDRLCFDFTSAPLDISEYDFIEFDIYIADYDAFKSAVAGKRINFNLASSDVKTQIRIRFDIEDQITKSGWNHIVLEKASRWQVDKDFTYKSIKWIMINFQDGGNETNPIGSTVTRVANLGLDYAEYSKLPALPKYEVLISESGSTPKRWGDKYSWALDQTRVDLTENPVDIEDTDRIEFDIYIADYEEFKSAVAGKRINFALASSDVRTKTRIRYDIEDKITKSGWNHIVLDKVAKWQVDSGFTFKEIKWAMITFQDGGDEPNPMKDTVVRIANICGTFAPHRYNPALPDNVVAQLGNPADGTDSRGNTVGAYFHYTLDKIYRSKMSPVDFSRAAVVEFDIYISDYEKFLAADNDPTDKEDSKLNFTVSSTKPGLWGQYQKPYVYYSAGVDLQPYIKHSGWNHVVVGKGEFVTYNHGVDWSGLTGYMIYYRHSSNFYPYKNANNDLYVKVANIVNTGVVADIPTDTKKALRPDKGMVYITSVEGVSDQYGAWNILDPVISTTYKTAGNASIQKTLDYNNGKDDTMMSYIFDGSADLSDLKTLKLDFFIDLPQYLNQPTNSVEVVLGSNRFGKTDYYAWKLDLSKMRSGWNTVSLPVANAKAVGNPDLQNIKLVMLRFTKLGLSKDNFEEIVYGIDNIRYLSSTGNTVLRINEEESGSDLFGGKDDDSFLTDDEPFTTDGEETEEATQKTVKKIGKTKVLKRIERTIEQDFLTAGIVLGIEAAALAIGFVVFILVYKKKKAKKTN